LIYEQERRVEVESIRMVEADFFEEFVARYKFLIRKEDSGTEIEVAWECGVETGASDFYGLVAVCVDEEGGNTL
jgi:hypothetical protein